MIKDGKCQHCAATNPRTKARFLCLCGTDLLCKDRLCRWFDGPQPVVSRSYNCGFCGASGHSARTCDKAHEVRSI